MNRQLLTVGAGLALALGVAGCDNDKITALNKNPNSPEDVPATTLFTNGVRVAVARWLGAGYSLRATEFVAQHLAEVQYPDEDRYVRLGPNDTRTYFDDPYSAELEDLQKVIDKGMAAEDASVYGPALVMRTWVFSYLTDTFGDIPYFGALKGDAPDGGTEALAPKYDPQKEIYADFFKVLDQASKDMAAATSGAGLGGADPIYGGDVLKWQRFANSLRARLALRLVNVDAATASQQIAAAIAAPGGLMTANADNAILRWPGDGIFNNPWSDNFKTRDDHRISLTLATILTQTTDPRLPVFAMPTVADPTKYAGLQNGLTHNAAQAFFNTTSRPGAVFYPGATAYGFFGGQGASFPSFLMTYADVAFIKAEAAERGLGGLTAGQAAGFYQAGVRASMEQWGVTNTPAIDAYLTQPGVAYAGATQAARLRLIYLQRWIAYYTDGGQAWALWRRTCVPETIKPGPAASQSNVPRRFRYSPTEYTVNNANLGAAVTTQGADVFTTRGYWDTQPQNAPTYFVGCGAR